MAENNNSHSILLSIAVIFLIAGSAILTLWQKEITGTLKAARPAEVDVIVLADGSCLDCFDVNILLDQLQKDSGTSSDKKIIDHDSEEGRVLMEKYRPPRLPALLISGETEKLLDQAPFLESFGRMDSGIFIADSLPPPYMETESLRVRGRYEIIYLVDESCADCYDAGVHRQILGNLIAFPFGEQTVDRFSSEGKAIIEDYGIEKLPTVILKGDLEVHKGFREVWEEVGSIEDDGAYVFREAELVGTYFDLTSGRIEN